jgi:hypothetical protein
MSASTDFPASAAGWPPEACRPPSWTLWECELPSSRRLTTTSPLADFHEWATTARWRIGLLGVEAADQFGESWVLGTRRERLRPDTKGGGPS